MIYQSQLLWVSQVKINRKRPGHNVVPIRVQCTGDDCLHGGHIDHHDGAVSAEVCEQEESRSCEQKVALQQVDRVSHA